MREWRRLTAVLLCAALLAGFLPTPLTMPTRAASEDGWTVRYDAAAFAEGTLSVEVYDAARGYAPAVEWTRDGGTIRAECTADALFPDDGVYYAVVQYLTGGKAGEIPSLSDEEIAAEYRLYYRAVYGVDAPPLELPEGFPTEGRAAALAWYAAALEDAAFCAACEEETGEALLSPDELVAYWEEEYDPEYDDLDELIVDAVHEILAIYAEYYEAEQYYNVTVAEKRGIIERLIRSPEQAPAGYAPPAATEGAEPACRVALHALSAQEKESGLAVEANFFDGCVPLTITAVQTGTDFDMTTYEPVPVYADTRAYLRADGATIPAGIALSDADDEELLGGDILAFAAGYEDSGRLNGRVPLGMPYLVTPGTYLVTSAYGADTDAGEEACLDWENVTVGANGGSADFTASRHFVRLNAAEDGPDDGKLQSLEVQFTGGDLGTALCGADLFAMSYENGQLTAAPRAMKLKPGDYDTAIFGVGASAGEAGGLTWFWKQEVGTISGDVSYTLPSRSLSADDYTTDLTFRSLEDDGTGPFRPGEALRAEVTLTAGDFRLIALMAMQIDPSALQGDDDYGDDDIPFEISYLKTTARFADGGAITPESGADFIWFDLTAPETSQTVEAVTALNVDGIVDLRFETSALVRVAGAEADREPPAAPTGLSAEAADETIAFRWTANTEEDLDGYRLYRTNAAGKNAVLLASAAKEDSALTIAVDRAAWGAAPWYFALSAVDAAGNESALGGTLQVNDPSIRFRGTGAWSAERGEAYDDGFYLTEEGEGRLAFVFTPDGDLVGANFPDEITLTLSYRDLEDAAKTRTLALAREDGYAAALDLPADAAVLEQAEFTYAAGDETATLATARFYDLNVVVCAHIRLPAAEYALAPAFDGASVSDAGKSWVLQPEEGGFAGRLPRAAYRAGVLALSLGARRFEVGGTLLSQTHEEDVFRIAAAAMPDMMRLHAVLEDSDTALLVDAWFVGGGSAMPAATDVIRNEAGEAEVLILRPAEARELGTLCLRVMPYTASDEYALFCTEGEWLLAEGGAPFTPGADETVRGRLCVSALEGQPLMYLDVAFEDGSSPRSDLKLVLTDETGAAVTAAWYWRTKQLATGALTAGAAYDVSVEDGVRLGSDPLRITALRDGSNQAAPPQLSIFRMAQVTLRVTLVSDDMTAYEDLAGSFTISAEPEVRCRDRVTGEWTALEGAFSHPQIYSNVWSPETRFQSGLIDARRLDTDSGLLLVFGTEAAGPGGGAAAGAGGWLYAGAPIRLCAGQVFYTVGNEANGELAASGLISRVESDGNGMNWYVGGVSVGGADEAAELRGLRVARTPYAALRITRETEYDALTFVLRERDSGATYVFAEELLHRNDGETVRYEFNTLPYGSYDVLMYVGSGEAQAQLERQFARDGAAAAVPASVCGCVVENVTLTESDAMIHVDLPAAPVTDAPGIQGITNVPDKTAALAGDRVTFTIRFVCVPGGSESERTLAMHAVERSGFAPDGTSVSLRTEDGTRLSAAVDGFDRVVVPENDGLVYGTVLVTGRIQDGRTPTFDAAVGSIDYAGGHYARGACSLQVFSATVRAATLVPTAPASGRGAAGAEITARITSRTDPARTSEQTTTVSRYGYWKMQLQYPVDRAEDEFDVQFLSSEGAVLAESVTRYVPSGVVPSEIHMTWMTDGTEQKITIYPGDERDFAMVKSVVLTFGVDMEETVVEIELVFDDSDPDDWGMTDARRVSRPMLQLKPKGSFFRYQYYFYAEDAGTFDLTVDEADEVLADVPYATKYAVRFWARDFGVMHVLYDVLPDKASTEFGALRTGAAPDEAMTEALRTVYGALEAQEEPIVHEGWFDCSVPDVAVDSLRMRDFGIPEDREDVDPDMVVTQPFKGTAHLHVDSEITVAPVAGGAEAAIAGFGTPEDADCVLNLTDEDSYLRYFDLNENYSMRFREDGTAELIVRRTWNSVLNAGALPAGDDGNAQVLPGLAARSVRALLPMDSGGGASAGDQFFSIVAEQETTIGFVTDVSLTAVSILDEVAQADGVVAIAKEGAGAALGNTASTVASGVGFASDVTSVGISVATEAQSAWSYDKAYEKERQYVFQQIEESCNYYKSKLTCRAEGSHAAEVEAKLNAIQAEYFTKTEKGKYSNNKWGNTAAYVTYGVAGAFGNLAVGISGVVAGMAAGVPFVGTAVGLVLGTTYAEGKEIGEENFKEWIRRQLWWMYEEAEGKMRQAFALYDPSVCDEKKEPPKPEKVNITKDDRETSWEFHIGGPVKKTDIELEPARILDPSGTVYEGMLSNPLAGVTVSIQYLDGETWRLWTEAGDYNDQQPTYVTDASGYYRWDVPDGKWRVKYDKEGYNGGEAVYSDVMDVPPVWLDVNQNMVDAGAFTAAAEAAVSGVSLRFTKPVYAADVTAESVALLRGETPVETAFAPEEQEGELAQRFAAACELDPAAEYFVRVTGVRSYAGTACTFTVPVDMSTLPVLPACEAVTASVPSGSTVPYGGTVALSCATPGAMIWYTLDGSCPCIKDNPARTVYTGPITITADVRIIARAEAEGYADGAPTPFDYYCAPPAEEPDEPTPPPTSAEPGFTDVAAGAYYEAAVRWAAEQGIAEGRSETIFDPAGECTRAEAVTFLWRAFGKPTATLRENPFTDVAENSFYYEAVLWAYERGITRGKGAGTFDPDAPVTRAQMVTFLFRAAGAQAPDAALPFIDVDGEEFYAAAVRWAVGDGITNGTGADTFRPDDACIRAQTVTFLYRYFG